MNKHTLKGTAASVKGSREGNQDNLRFGNMHPFIDQNRSFQAFGVFSTDDTQFFCVCDGVGGAEKGDMASAGALMELRRYLDEHPVGTLEECVLAGAERAQDYLLWFYRQIQMTGGSTMALVGVRGEQYAALNIGDSPIYLFRRRSGTLEELSVRHTKEWACRIRGQEPPPRSASTLVHYLGKEDARAEEMAHITTGTLLPGDTLLLCSDGVSDVFSEKQLRRMMKWNLHARCLTRKAAAHPDSDNCTAIVLQFRV